jgi:predicted DNA-binding transcriptional regulator AlpA
MDQYMDVDEFAELTRRSTGRIHHLSSAGKLEVKPIKVGKRLLWDRQEVEAWLNTLKAARQ